MRPKRLETVVDGLRFPEGNRWHEGALWFADMHSGEILRLVPGAGTPAVVAAIDGQASGLGWLATGHLVVSAMNQRKLIAIASDGSQSVYCDLTALSESMLNDLLVDGETNVTYVGAFGFDAYAGAPARPGQLYAVDATNSARLAADELAFPNSAVILPGTRTLVVAETWGGCLTAFDVNENGDLVHRRVWARLEAGVMPDGSCADLDGGVWIASLKGGEFQRVLEGGRVTDRIPTFDRYATDCVLGGADGTTLFLSTADSLVPRVTAGTRRGRIQAVEVAVPGPPN